MTTIAALTLGTTVPGVARAALPEPAYLTRVLWLEAIPLGGDPARVDRFIYLKPGNYRWVFDIVKPNGDYVPSGTLYRNITLAEGVYYWECWVSPREYDYLEGCQLSTPGHTIAKIDGDFYIDVSDNYAMSGVLRPY
jgi:hypothetical protein